LHSGTTVGNEHLCYAARNGHVAVLQEFLAAGVDVNADDGVALAGAGEWSEAVSTSPRLYDT
jgi:hypothetical protein